MQSLNIPAEHRWRSAFRNLSDPERLLRERPSLEDAPLETLSRLWRELVGEKEMPSVVLSFSERHRVTVETALRELHAAILARLTESHEVSGLIRADDFTKRFRIDKPDELSGPASLLGASIADLPEDHWIRESIDPLYDFHGSPSVIFGPALSHGPTTPRAFYLVEQVAGWTRQLASIQQEQRRIARVAEQRQREQERAAHENSPQFMRQEVAELKEQVAALTQERSDGNA